MCAANQLTGFHMIGTLFLKRLINSFIYSRCEFLLAIMSTDWTFDMILYSALAVRHIVT